MEQLCVSPKNRVNQNFQNSNFDVKKTHHFFAPKTRDRPGTVKGNTRGEGTMSDPFGSDDSFLCSEGDAPLVRSFALLEPPLAVRVCVGMTRARSDG